MDNVRSVDVPTSLELLYEGESREGRPQAEVVYLLQTTSQGRRRREIKLQPASEGVTSNTYLHKSPGPLKS